MQNYRTNALLEQSLDHLGWNQGKEYMGRRAKMAVVPSRIAATLAHAPREAQRQFPRILLEGVLDFPGHPTNWPAGFCVRTQRSQHPLCYPTRTLRL